MSKHEFHFAVISKTTFVHETGSSSSSVKSNHLRLEVSPNLDKAIYTDNNSLPTKDAIKPISSCLIMGLITNMRMGAQKGWWKEGEHMEWVIKNLQEAFVAVGTDAHAAKMEY